MKTFITLSTILAAGTLAANAATILCTFGTNAGGNFVQETLTAGTDTWNYFHGGNYAGGTTEMNWYQLSFANGTQANSNVSLWTQGCFGGSDAVANTFTGSDSSFTDLFPNDVWKGALHGADNAEKTQFKINGLVIGESYVLDVLIGSGSVWKNGTSVCSIASGAQNTTLSIVAQNGNDSATPVDGSVPIVVSGGENTASSWAILRYEFEATETSVKFQAASGSTDIADDVGGFRLTGIFIPEPSMFGLLAGVGALALAGTRRRRR